MPVIRSVADEVFPVPLIQGEKMRSHALETVVGLPPMGSDYCSVYPMIEWVVPVPVLVGGLVIGDELIPTMLSRPRSVDLGNLINNNSVISTPCGALVPVFGVTKFNFRVSGSTNLFVISGITRNNTGSALGNCTVYAFNETDEKVGVTVSDGSGVYSIIVPTNSPHYVTAYLTGSPDRAGHSVRTLTPE